MKREFRTGYVYDLNRTGTMVVSTMLPKSPSKSVEGYLVREGGEPRCYGLLDFSLSYNGLDLNARTVREFPLDEGQKDIANKVLERAGI